MERKKNIPKKEGENTTNMPAKRRESKRKDDSLGVEAEKKGNDMKGKVTKPSASPMRKKATAQLLREKGKVDLQ